MGSYTVYELRDSESGSVENENEGGEVWNVTKRYLIGQCPGGFGEAKEAIAEYLPRYWDAPAGYFRRKGITIKGVGRQCFECTGEYTTLIPMLGEDAGGEGQQPEDTRQFVPGSIAWDAIGVTENVKSALGEKVYGGTDTPDFSYAINVDKGNVQGTDKVVPSMKYSETWIVPTSVAMDYEFVGAVYSLTGTVNSAKFRAFQPGEALFLGARAQWNGDQPYTTVTFDFQARPNNDNFYVKGIGPVKREGWEFPWVHYADETNAGMLVQIPKHLILNTIYEKKDWSPLLIVDKTPGAKQKGTKAQTAETAAAVTAFFSS